MLQGLKRVTRDFTVLLRLQLLQGVFEQLQRVTMDYKGFPGLTKC